VVAIVGPTASGKTAMAIAAARRLNGELVSVDSRQVYRHCDIGTNKPTPDELGGLHCRLIDVVDPGTPFTVADYQPLAIEAVAVACPFCRVEPASTSERCSTAGTSATHRPTPGCGQRSSSDSNSKGWSRSMPNCVASIRLPRRGPSGIPGG